MTDENTVIKITREEFKKQLEALAEKLEDNQCFMVLLYDEDKKDIEYNGVGCPACAADIILQMIMSKEFKHTGPDPGIKH